MAHFNKAALELFGAQFLACESCGVRFHPDDAGALADHLAACKGWPGPSMGGGRDQGASQGAEPRRGASPPKRREQPAPSVPMGGGGGGFGGGRYDREEGGGRENWDRQGHGDRQGRRGRNGEGGGWGGSRARDDRYAEPGGGGGGDDGVALRRAREGAARLAESLEAERLAERGLAEHAASLLRRQVPPVVPPVVPPTPPRTRPLVHKRGEGGGLECASLCGCWLAHFKEVATSAGSQFAHAFPFKKISC